MKTRWRLKRRREEAKLFKRFGALLKHPMFWVLTFTGNAMIVAGSFLLYSLEGKINKIEFIDCVLWSTSIVTTVGYVNMVPQTFEGKIVVIVLMLIGTVFIWSYMAFLVTALISPALNSLEKEIQDVEKDINELILEENKNLAVDKKT